MGDEVDGGGFATDITPRARFTFYSNVEFGLKTIGLTPPMISGCFDYFRRRRAMYFTLQERRRRLSRVITDIHFVNSWPSALIHERRKTEYRNTLSQPRHAIIYAACL